MTATKTIELTDAARLHAEERAREEGFSSIDEYVDALIRDDRETGLDRPWFRERIREGLASGNAGPLTRARLSELVGRGIERAERKQ